MLLLWWMVRAIPSGNASDSMLFSRSMCCSTFSVSYCRVQVDCMNTRIIPGNNYCFNPTINNIWASKGNVVGCITFKTIQYATLLSKNCRGGVAGTLITLSIYGCAINSSIVIIFRLLRYLWKILIILIQSLFWQPCSPQEKWSPFSGASPCQNI